jgi:hypothetical protein
MPEASTPPTGATPITANDPRAITDDADLSAQGLDALPPRATGAPTGSQFCEKAQALGLAAREELFFDEVTRGNVPSFLRRFHRVTVSAPGAAQQGAVFVCPDYLAVGSDADFLRMPVTAMTAQRLADACRCVLPTKKLVDDIFAASMKQDAIPVWSDLESFRRFVQHNEEIEDHRKVGSLGDLLAGHKKDIVLTRRLQDHPRRLALYGFFWQGRPLQPLDTSLTVELPHDDVYVDYSHGVRLVGRVMVIGEERARVEDVLADPQRCALVSGEGVIGAARYVIHGIDS